jgi:hypothetical protein
VKKKNRKEREPLGRSGGSWAATGLRTKKREEGNRWPARGSWTAPGCPFWTLGGPNLQLGRKATPGLLPFLTRFSFSFSIFCFEFLFSFKTLFYFYSKHFKKIYFEYLNKIERG